jgi:hypothetical protein
MKYKNQNLASYLKELEQSMLSLLRVYFLIYKLFQYYLKLQLNAWLKT